MNERTTHIYFTVSDPAVAPGIPGKMRIRLRSGKVRTEPIPPLDTFRELLERPEIENIEFVS